MKWIVKSDFYRTSQLKKVKIVGCCEGGTKEAPHEDHFHRGAIIELGESATESELQLSRKDDEETKQLIAALRVAGRIGDASDKDVVKHVVDEVAAANKRAAYEEEVAAKTEAKA